MSLATRSLAAALVATCAVACAAETAEPAARTTGGATSDAGTAEAPVPPGAAGNDGREDTASMCFATCQNVAFSCKGTGSAKQLAFVAQLAFEMPGCKGSFAEGTSTSSNAASGVTLAVDCSTRKVCLGVSPGEDPSACAQGTFSAFSFAFPLASAAGATVVCTRE